MENEKTSLVGVVEKAPLTRGVGGFMARKDGGESEGIVLYPSRSPSLGWKPTPPGPPCQGGKGHAPDEGFFNSPRSEDLFADRRGKYYVPG